MGMFQVAVGVANPNDRSRAFEEKFWVDTGAFYSLIPEDRLAEIGVAPLQTRAVSLADGRRDRRLLGETLTCPVIFGPRGTLFLLGATALEIFAVQADPTNQELKQLAAIIIGGFLASSIAPDRNDYRPPDTSMNVAVE